MATLFFLTLSINEKRQAQIQYYFQNQLFSAKVSITNKISHNESIKKPGQFRIQYQLQNLSNLNLVSITEPVFLHKTSTFECHHLLKTTPNRQHLLQNLSLSKSISTTNLFSTKRFHVKVRIKCKTYPEFFSH